MCAREAQKQRWVDVWGKPFYYCSTCVLAPQRPFLGIFWSEPLHTQRIFRDAFIGNGSLLHSHPRGAQPLLFGHLHVPGIQGMLTNRALMSIKL